MNIKLQYDLHEIGDASQKAIVAIHGWQGDCNSMYPLIKSTNIKNVGWYLLEAPFPVKNGEGFSWSYEKSNGQWEIDEPRHLLNVFFDELFKIYDSRKIFVSEKTITSSDNDEDDPLLIGPSSIITFSVLMTLSIIYRRKH